MTNIKVGFVGLGIMGKPMAKNLINAGHSLTVFDKGGSAVEELVASGAQAVKTTKEVAEKSSVVITMLPDSQDSEDVILGDNALLEGSKPGSAILDMSSIAPAMSQKIGAAC